MGNDFPKVRRTLVDCEIDERGALDGLRIKIERAAESRSHFFCRGWAKRFSGSAGFYLATKAGDTDQAEAQQQEGG